MSRELCPCGMGIKCRYVVTRKDGTKLCSQDFNCFASNRWLVEHDFALLDRCSMIFKSIIRNCHGQMSSETEKELFADIDTFIAAMKAEVDE